MTRRMLPVLLLVPLLAVCKTAPIYDVVNAPISGPALSLEEVSKRIERAARLQRWDVEPVSPGMMIVTKRKGGHAAAANVRYDTRRFDITLRDSVALKQSPDGTIHKLYNVWVEDLERTIRQEVSAPN